MKLSLLLSLLMSCGFGLLAQAPDNTKSNQHDPGVTADDQKMNKADTELVQRIRSDVYQDKSLSTYAHNIKIIAQDGRVTLRGPVRSEAEKMSIQAKAVRIAGADRVANQLDVTPDKK